MKLFLQSEAAECGLACLAMVASHHGQGLDLTELRRRFPVSLKGAKLASLISHAGVLGFSARPLKVELEHLAQLPLPCILHWDLNHFVVLKKVGARSCVVLDPAVGERRLTMAEMSEHFTGVALELTPQADFKPVKQAPRLSLASLTGRVSGLKRSLAQILAVALVLEVFAVVAPLFNQLVVDEVLSSGDVELLGVLILGFGLLLLIQTALSLGRSWMVVLLSQTLALQWQSNVFAHLIRLPTSFFEKRHLGDITSRFGAVNAIQRSLTTAALEAVLDGLMALIALAMMLLYSVPLTAIVLGAVAAYGALRWLAYRPFRDASAERLVIAAKESTHFLETLRAITPLKLYGREDERRARWQNLIVDVQNRDVRTAKMSMAFQTAHTLIFGLENLAVLWLGARTILQGQQSHAVALTVGMLFAFVSYKTQFTSRVGKLIDYGVELKMLSLHGERLADIVLEAPEPDEVPHSDLEHLEPSLELRHVSFRYAEGEPWILKDANLRIEAGEHVAVTGPSGAGKTTLLKVLLGLLPPTEGEVLFGGVPVRQLGVRNVRRQIGTVMQEDALLTGSLADNISFFDTQPDDERIRQCAALAQFHEDIARMPMGYQTLVGDLGSGLSGGQKQRLLLARALYKQPRVLALDEATSHLDVANERAVTAALAQLKLTRLVIAHRPETIAGALRVVQVRDGQVLDVARQVVSGPPDSTAA